MAYEDLIKSIESTAEEKKLEVIQSAEREVEAIIREAETESSAIHAQYLKKAERDLILESNRQKFLARQEVKTEINAVRLKLIDDAFALAKDSLSSIRSDSSYPALFEQLAQEVITALVGEEIVLHIDPADSVICMNVIKKLGADCEVMQDITTSGGLSGSSEDGKIRADNTLECRLEKIRSLSTLEITSLILGDPDG